VQAAIGTYPVTFTTAKGTSKTVRAIVDHTHKPNPNPNPSIYEKIIAEDFKIDADEVATLDDATVISLAHAEAWNTADFTDVAITYVDYSNIQATKGVYPVTFATANNTAITVNAIVEYERTPNVNDNEKIIADDFTLTIAQATTLTTTEAIQFATHTHGILTPMLQ